MFMKGTPEAPQCGFSRAAIQVLELQGVPPEKLKTYNVLEDAELRSSIKEFSCVIDTIGHNMLSDDLQVSGPPSLNYT